MGNVLPETELFKKGVVTVLYRKYIYTYISTLHGAFGMKRISPRGSIKYSESESEYINT